MIEEVAKRHGSIELRHLRYFVAVAEHGGFRRASAAVGVQVSSISRRIRDLEDRLGAALFHRDSTGIRLTFAGKRFLPRARKIIRHLGEGAQDIAAVGRSEPLAVAILTKADQAGIEALPSRDAKALMGKGVVATVGDASAWVSSPRYALENGGIDPSDLQLATALEEDGKTAVAVFREKTPLGLIAMRDEPRQDAADAVRQLTAMGVTSVILTGDNPRTAAAIAGGLGMEFRADMMPEDKLTAIREMGGQGGVMMIGDGINDAPALKQASIGVAMGSGTDVALETADAAILRDRVTDIPALIRLAHTAMGNIRQNITIALGLKAVFLVTSVLGITGLWIAIMADTGATVLVTLNALRLLRFDPEREA